MSKCVPVQLAYYIIEPEEDADETLCPIIFLHAFYLTKELWHNIPQIICNKTKRKGYVCDARDHGDSEWTDNKFSFNNTFDDLVYFMELQSIEKAVFIGHSMGGWTASRLAMKFPERVELIIVEDMTLDQLSKETVDSALFYMLKWNEALNEVPAYVPKEDAIRAAVDYLYSMIPSERKEWLTPKKRMYECDFSLRKVNGCYAIALNVPAILKAVQNLKTLSSPPEGIYHGPAYFIYGTSSLFPVMNREENILKHFPQTKFIPIEGATHNVHIDMPEKYTKIVLECLLNPQNANI